MSAAAGPAVAVYEAERIPGPDGAVERGATPLAEGVAVLRLQAGNDVVVCGPVRRANRNKARELMTAAFGGFEEDMPHEGRMALPHFHPPGHTPAGVHAFYEAPPRHAKKRKS
ncbi:MAG TPA: hypothetical protein VJ739_04575 [Gemmataceae bacterium]|nr:hypothetical protein [Gemmataceae bacterium]